MTLWPDFRSLASASTLSGRDLAQRALLLLAIVALHLVIILWLAGGRSPARLAAPAVMSVFTVPLSSAHGTTVQPLRIKLAPPPVAPPSVLVVPAELPIADSTPVPAAASASPGAETAAAGCALARDAGEAIGKDPSAMAELDALPPGIRTSTDAVMLWNGQWLDLGIMPADIDTNALRRVVEQVAADAPVECRDAAAIGPQFIPVPEGNRTVMIVIGSGAWHWSDLSPSPSECAPDGHSTCPKAELPVMPPVTKD